VKRLTPMVSARIVFEHPSLPTGPVNVRNDFAGQLQFLKGLLNFALTQVRAVRAEFIGVGVAVVIQNAKHAILALGRFLLFELSLVLREIVPPTQETKDSRESGCHDKRDERDDCNNQLFVCYSVVNRGAHNTSLLYLGLKKRSVLKARGAFHFIPQNLRSEVAV